MVKRSHGAMSRRTKRLKGKTRATIPDFIRTFSVGERVVIAPMAYHIGLPALRYTNKSGIITEQRGQSYVVEILDGKKKKQIISHPIHLK